MEVELVGLFGPLFQRQEKHKLGICIPDVRRERRVEVAEAPEPASTKGFAITGIFHVQDVLMVQGIAGGTIRKKAKTRFGGSTLVVKDIQVGKENPGKIEEGQKGALFLKPEKGRFPVLRQGDELEF